MTNLIGKLCLLFPGQGSQSLGMGKCFFDNFPEAREVFLEADDILSRHLSKVIFDGTPDDLKKTSNSQLAIMVTSVAILRVLEKVLGLDAAKASCVIGHSLGEYSALVAVGSFSFRDAVSVLDVRARAMENALPAGIGGMAAVLGLSIEQVEDVCSGSIQIANYNCPGQIVVSGLLEDFPQFEEKVKVAGCKRLMRLEVSGPFHSKFMEGAGLPLAKALDSINAIDPVVPIISNVTADFEQSISEIFKLLIKQLISRIRFKECVDRSVNSGVKTFLEIGNGKVLTGLVKRCASDALTFNASLIEDIEILSKSGIF